MHNIRGMNYIIWKDKCPILFIFIHANPIGFPCMPRNKVPRWNEVVRKKITTSLMFLKYATFMRGVDVID
jgi:hypothetical protein